MKLLKSLRWASLLLPLVASISPASAKAPTFTKFSGKYQGTLSVNATFETFSVPVQITLKPASHGQTAVISVTGNTPDQPIVTSFTFGKKKAASVVGLISPADPTVATGTYKFKKNKVKSTVVLNEPPAPATVTLTLTLTDKGLKMVGSLVEPIDPMTVQTGTLLITAKKKK